MSKCPECGGTLHQSHTDPADPYWYCAEEACDWTGYIRQKRKTLRQEMAEMDAQEADKRRRAREIEWAVRDKFIRAAVRSDAAKRGWLTRRQRESGNDQGNR